MRQPPPPRRNSAGCERRVRQAAGAAAAPARGAPPELCQSGASSCGRQQLTRAPAAGAHLLRRGHAGLPLGLLLLPLVLPSKLVRRRLLLLVRRREAGCASQRPGRALHVGGRSPRQPAAAVPQLGRAAVRLLGTRAWQTTRQQRAGCRQQAAKRAAVLPLHSSSCWADLRRAGRQRHRRLLGLPVLPAVRHGACCCCCCCCQRC